MSERGYLDSSYFTDSRKAKYEKQLKQDLSKDEVGMPTKLPPPMISTTCKETYPSFLSEMQAPESIIESPT